MAPTKSTGDFTNKRGQKLYTQNVLPDVPAVAAMLWHIGFGEYSDRQDKTFTVLAEAGIAVFSFDSHGMGKSEPTSDAERSLVKKFDHLVEDSMLYLDLVQAQMKEKGLAVPLFMGGNSLGGLVASYTIIRRPEAFAGLIMQSPAIDVEWTPVLKVQAAVGNILAAVVPKAKLVPAVRPEDMSQDPEVVAAYVKDPLIYQGNVKALSGNEILKGFRALAKHRADFTMPILAVHGTVDRCTSLSATKKHLAAVPSKDVTLVEIEGGYHELLLGPEKERVWKLFIDWMTEHAAKAAAQAAAAPPAAATAEAVPAVAAAAEAAPAAAAPAAAAAVDELQPVEPPAAEAPPPAEPPAAAAGGEPAAEAKAAE